MKHPFSMCVLYRDDGTRFKKYFTLKVLALDWFEQFQKENKRPVTVTFYCDVVPYWTYRKD